MPGVHAVLTHDDVPGEKLYGLEFQDQPVLAIDRVLYYGEPVALVAAEHPEQARRAAESIRVEYEPLEPVADMERATELPDLHPEQPTHGHGYLDDPRPNVVRHIRIRHGDVGGGRRRRRRAASTRSASRIRRSSVPSRASPCPTAKAASTSTSRPSGCTSTGRRSRRASACRSEQVRIHLARRRRRVRRARGPLDAGARRDARAAHEPAGEDRLQPRGVVHRPRAPPSGAHLVRASRDARRAARQRAHADPARRRRLRVVLDRGRVERRVVRDRPVRVAERADRVDGRLHEQPAVRCDARLRRRADVLRRARRRWTSSPPRSTSTRSSCGC